MKKVLLSVTFLLIVSIFDAYCQQYRVLELDKISIPDSVVITLNEVEKKPPVTNKKFVLTMNEGRFESIKSIKVSLVSGEQSFEGETEVYAILSTKNSKLIQDVVATAKNFKVSDSFAAKKIKVIIELTSRMERGIAAIVRSITAHYDIEKKTWE